MVKMINGNSSTHRKITILSSLLIGVLLTLSSMATRPASAANPSVTPGQWTGSEGVYPNNWDYANQTQITPANVNQLQVSWVYPTPPTPSQYLAYNKFTTVPIGITFTGSMINGIVYTMTQYMLLQAMNAHTGALIWSAQLPNMKFNCMHNNVPPPGGSNLTGHFHNIWYTSGVKGVWANTPMIWVMGSNHTGFAYNALTGSLLEHWQTYNPCAKFANGATMVPGNFGVVDSTTQNAVVDAARGVIVTSNSIPESTDASRGFFVGWNISVNPPKQLWTTFYSPPQDGSNPNWTISDVQNMSNAWIFDAPNGSAVNLKTLPAATLKSVLYDDWGYTKSFDGTHSWSGAGGSWGGNWALDTTTGNAFVATAEPSDYPNASLRPGPNLWADSVLSVNDVTGTTNWAFETDPHDLWDMDCSWTDMLATITVNGAPDLAVIKTCKSGYMWALEAATGKMLWYFSPGPSDVGYNGLPNSVCSGASSCAISTQGSKFKASVWWTPTSHQLDPLNRSQMTRPWPNYPSKSWNILMPYGQGCCEFNAAYDPTNSMIVYGAMNDPSNSTAGPANGAGVSWGQGTSKATGAPALTQYYNATIWGINANTGQPVWNRFIPLIGIRGGNSITDGMVIVPLDNGSLLFLNDQTGALIRNLFIGSAMVTQPIIGTDSTGKTAIVLPAELPITSGVYATTGRTTSTPGFLFAVALGPNPGPFATVTSTSTVAGAPTTSTATATVTSSGSGTVKTVTSTGSASVATVVQNSGIDPTTFYAVAALAVIFVIAAGFLALRGRKSAAT